MKPFDPSTVIEHSKPNSKPFKVRTDVESKKFFYLLRLIYLHPTVLRLLLQPPLIFINKL